MAWPSSRSAYLLLTFLGIIGIMLVIIGLAGGPDVLGWTITPIFAAILLWFMVPELRQRQTGRMRALLWVGSACAVVLLAGTAVELAVT